VLRNGGDHFRREARRHADERIGVRGVGEQPVAQFAHGQMRDFREGLGRVIVDDEPRHLVFLIGNQGFVQERA
jgi:hypothetical protein